MMRCSLLLSVLLAAAIALFCSTSVSASAGPHRITSLPGFTGALDEMYTGYLSTNDGFDSQLFYWLSKARVPNPSVNTPVEGCKRGELCCECRG